MKKVAAALMVLALSVVAVLAVHAQGNGPARLQSFEQDTAGWLDNDISGPGGWCGKVARYERGSGPVMPSKGHGYAIAEQGPCNEFWMNNGWPASGPYAPFAGNLEGWPASGFVAALDIYLDPAWTAGSGFQYAFSVSLPDGTFRYFPVTVAVDGGSVMVAGYPVTEAGWYTFRVIYGAAADGALTVDFELAQQGHVLFSQPVDSTLFTQESTSSFAANSVLPAYSWFEISDGLELPIDHYHYRPGTK